MVRIDGDQYAETIEDAPPHTHFDENFQENYESVVGHDDPQNWQPADDSQAAQQPNDPNNVNNNSAPPPLPPPPQSNTTPPPQAFPPPSSRSQPQPQPQPQAFPPPSSRPQPQPQPQAFPPPQFQLGGQNTAFQANQNVQPPQAFPPSSPSQYNQQQGFPPNQSQFGGQKPGFQAHQNVQPPQAFPPPSPSQYNQQQQQQGFPSPQSQFGGQKPGFQAHQQQTFPSNNNNIQYQNQGFQQQETAFQKPNNNQFQNQGFQQQAGAFQQPQYSAAAPNYIPQTQGGGFQPMQQQQQPSPQMMQQQQQQQQYAGINNPAATGIPMLNQNPSAQLPTQGWRTGLFDCMDDPGNAILTAFAPCVTFGQIAEVVDSGQTSCATSGLIYGLVASFIGVPCLISFGYRSKMRARFGLIEAPAQDWLVHFLCEWCSLCQEYRELQIRGLDPAIGWLGNVAKSQQQAQMAPMTPPYNQTMMA